MTRQLVCIFSSIFSLAVIGLSAAAQPVSNDTSKPLHPGDFQHWQLPATPPSPPDNKTTPARVHLGKMLFFDPRVSRNGITSCATCHNPALGWSDALPTGRGFQETLLSRASSSIVNVGYNSILLWDGRKKKLEDQVMGPLQDGTVMNTDLDHFFKWMNSSAGYIDAFAEAYPSEPIDHSTFSKAIAAFERSVVSRDSPFDRWVAGDKSAMTGQQLRGLQVFRAPDKGNCVVCHAAPNFTDNGFHNLGLRSFGKEKPDLGRYAQKPVPSMKGAFKTPGLRDVEYTAPYFHDGSAKTLMDVVEHYAKGGEVRSNLSPDIKPLNLSQVEKEDLVAFLKALSTPLSSVTLPVLPPN